MIRRLFSTVLALAAFGLAGAGAAEPDVERGAYIFHAASCAGCHTPKDGAFLAGGRALATRFGTFYSPNITPDPETGIGDWSFAAFAQALRHGLSPSGEPYYPAFPFTSYRGIAERDLADLWAYLRSVEPVRQANRPHELSFPYSLRSALWVWRWLKFEPDAPVATVMADEPLARGAYLVEVLGHCQECHTPRDLLGATRPSRAFAGNPDGPEGDRVPNITPDPQAGIGAWSAEDIATYLKSGMTPDFDFAGGAMGGVIADSTSKLTDADRAAIVAYLKALPPRPRE